MGAVVLTAGYWFPICEECDTDAVSLRLEAGAWWFHCPPHSRLGDQAIRDVELGWRPAAEDSAWMAAITAIRGVRKPTPGQMAAATLAAPPRPPRAQAPAWTPHDAIPDEPIVAHWTDDIPVGPEPEEEDWR